jgi:hypothetical protein
VTTGSVTTVVAKEAYLNLVIDPSQANDAVATVNAASQLIALTAAAGSTGQLPAQTGRRVRRSSTRAQQVILRSALHQVMP